MTPPNGPGRPPKPDAKKRQPLHISLYQEDLERLSELTDNRSEFLRHCIHSSWDKQQSDTVTLSLSLPKWLVEELVSAVASQLPPPHAQLVRTLARGWLAHAARPNEADNHAGD